MSKISKNVLAMVAAGGSDAAAPPSTNPEADGGDVDADEDGIVEVDPSASRAERRRAERSNRKNASKKKKRR